MATTYTFQTINNPDDLTFNQLLGIDTAGAIAGYFGSGAAGHPNQGYVRTTAGTFIPEDFPGSVQTQVTGINNNGYTVGFYAPTNNASGVNANYGFVHKTVGSYTAVFDPLTPAASSTVTPTNQLLGINSSNVAVGFYTDASGLNHGYTYTVSTGAFSTPITISGDSTTAAAINNAGDIAGFYTDSLGTHGFLDVGGTIITLNDPGFTFNGLDTTQFFGINGGLVVGDAVGPKGKMFGIVYNMTSKTWEAFSDPNGIGTTTFNGINSKGDIVGFYVDSMGNTDGFLATPSTTPVGPSVVETGATAQSFDAWSLLAPDAGMHSSLHYESNGRDGYNGLSVAVASVGHGPT
jgi:hypothetical protein